MTCLILVHYLFVTCSFDFDGEFASTHHLGEQLERVDVEIVGVRGVYTH